MSKTFEELEAERLEMEQKLLDIEKAQKDLLVSSIPDRVKKLAFKLHGSLCEKSHIDGPHSCPWGLVKEPMVDWSADHVTPWVDKAKIVLGDLE